MQGQRYWLSVGRPVAVPDSSKVPEVPTDLRLLALAHSRLLMLGKRFDNGLRGYDIRHNVGTRGRAVAGTAGKGFLKFRA